jgi:gliding motility-associated-like protein
MPSNVTVEQPASPVAGTAVMREPHCFGDHNGQVILTPSGGTPPYRYALDDKPFNGSSVQIGLTAGTYDPKIMDNNGCLLKMPPIEVTQPEKLSVDLGPDFQIVFGQDTQLLALVFNAAGDYKLYWSPSDTTWLSCPDCINPSVYSLQYSNYFEAYVLDSLGCRAEDQVLISIERPRKVFVPTAFSPNGDLTNDLLLVHGQKTSKALSFRVYDRWGEMVYEAKDFDFNDPNTGWDGTFRGQAMDPGVYVWVLQVQYVDGMTELYKGNTTLIR